MAIHARCGSPGEIPPGSSKVVSVNEHVVAIFNLGGTYYAIDNVCPHQGGPLGEGHLEENGVVSCPWHAWNFDIRTGQSPIDPDVKVRTFPVRVENGQLIVQIE